MSTITDDAQSSEFFLLCVVLQYNLHTALLDLSMNEKKGQANASNCKRMLPCLFIRRQEVSTVHILQLRTILLPRCDPTLSRRARGPAGLHVDILLPRLGAAVGQARRPGRGQGHASGENEDQGVVVTDGDILREHAARPREHMRTSRWPPRQGWGER
jgi:hypothetical protein